MTVCIISQSWARFAICMHSCHCGQTAIVKRTFPFEDLDLQFPLRDNQISFATVVSGRSELWFMDTDGRFFRMFAFYYFSHFHFAIAPTFWFIWRFHAFVNINVRNSCPISHVENPWSCCPQVTLKIPTQKKREEEFRRRNNFTKRKWKNNSEILTLTSSNQLTRVVE